MHGEDETRRVIAASQALFGRGELRELDEATLDAALAEAPTGEVRLADAPTIVDLLVATGLVAEPGRRAPHRQRGRRLREQREGRPTRTGRRTRDDLLHGRWLVLRRGKRTHCGGRRSLADA